MDMLRIIGLEGGLSGIIVEAQFNPKEVSIDKSVPWQLQQTKGPGDLQFSSANPKTMSFELMFDGFASSSSIQSEIGMLHQLTDIDANLKRPPKVKVIWGTEGAAGMMPAFEGVIESIGVKYTMFDSQGTPLRATVSMRFVEARKLKVVKPPTP